MNEQAASSALDFPAIGRVVESVRQADMALGGEYLLPENAEHADWEKVRTARDGLSFSISWAYTLREIHGDWTSDSRAKRRFDALGRALRLSRKLAAILKDEELPLTASLIPWFRTTDDIGSHVVNFSQFLAGLDLLKEASEQERERLKKSGFDQAAALSPDKSGSRLLATPGHSFMTGLGKAFEKGFGTAPFIKFTSDREAAGPFVHFVEAVTREMGETMSRDAIRKAWDRASAGQTPQKI